MNPLRRYLASPKFWSTAVIGYWLTLLVATHLPNDFPAVPSEGVDKFVHLGAFAALAWLLAMAWQRSAGRLGGGHLRAAWLLIVIYAAVDELSQPWFGRSCSLSDWLADAAGAALGLIVFTWLRPG
jgi:VanZ family protein